MPVRSLNSAVLRWPDRQVVHAAAVHWAARLAGQEAEVKRVAYFGSYARGDWGVGSDLDLLVIVGRNDLPFEQRASSWDLTDLPVPAEVRVYTEPEWATLKEAGGRFVREAEACAVWVWKSPSSQGEPVPVE